MAFQWTNNEVALIASGVALVASFGAYRSSRLSTADTLTQQRLISNDDRLFTERAKAYPMMISIFRAWSEWAVKGRPRATPSTDLRQDCATWQAALAAQRDAVSIFAGVHLRIACAEVVYAHSKLVNVLKAGLDELAALDDRPAGAARADAVDLTAISVMGAWVALHELPERQKALNEAQQFAEDCWRRAESATVDEIQSTRSEARPTRQLGGPFARLHLR